MEVYLGRQAGSLTDCEHLQETCCGRAPRFAGENAVGEISRVAQHAGLSQVDFIEGAVCRVVDVRGHKPQDSTQNRVIRLGVPLSHHFKVIGPCWLPRRRRFSDS